MEDGNVQFLPEPLLDLEAPGRSDVLEVDAAEDRRHELHGLDDLVHVLGAQTDRKGIDAGKLLEEHRLAFHHRQGRLRPDVAEPENRRAVGHHGDGVVLDRQREGTLPVVPDRQAHACDPGCVGHGEVVAGTDRHLVADLDLAPEVHEKRAIGDGADADPRHALEPADDLLGVDAVARLDCDVPLGPLAGRLDKVDGADVAPGVSDRRCHSTEHPWAIGDLQPDDEAVARARGHHGRRFYPLCGWVP